MLERLSRNINQININDLMAELFANQSFRDYIVELNTQDQLFLKGIDANNRVLKSDFAFLNEVYALRTISEKQRKGQPTDRVTLKDSGEFHRSFKTRLNGNNDVEIIADTLKESGDLLDTWGKDILGLTPENIEKLRVKALEILNPIIREKLLAA